MLWADTTHDVLKYVCLNLFKAFFKIRKPLKQKVTHPFSFSGFQNFFEVSC